MHRRHARVAGDIPSNHARACVFARLINPAESCSSLGRNRVEGSLLVQCSCSSSASYLRPNVAAYIHMYICKFKHGPCAGDSCRRAGCVWGALTNNYMLVCVGPFAFVSPKADRSLKCVCLCCRHLGIGGRSVGRSAWFQEFRLQVVEQWKAFASRGEAAQFIFVKKSGEPVGQLRFITFLVVFTSVVRRDSLVLPCRL